MPIVADSPLALTSATLPAPDGRDGGEGSVYVARIALDRDRIAVDGRWARITPGMAVTAETLTGQRWAIDDELLPIARYTANTGRER